MAAAMARPWPVLPDVGSTIVPPGFSAPARSAASTILRPMRSLTLPPGFSVSSLARTVGRTPWVTLWRRTSGVFPTASRNDSKLPPGRGPDSFSTTGAPGREGLRQPPDPRCVAEVDRPVRTGLHRQDGVAVAVDDRL